MVIGLVRMMSAKVPIAFSSVVFISLALIGCGGRVPDITPAVTGVVSQDPQSWYIMHSEGMADHPQAASGAAWSVLLPNAGRLGYVQTPYRPTVRPQQIIVTFEVAESPDAIPVSSDAGASPCREHDPCTPVAEFHIFFEQRGDDLTSETGRWWYQPGFRLTNTPDDSYDGQLFVADGQPHTITIPLSADQWTSVTGRGTAANFETALMNAGYVGITFGGSDFFGQGVSVERGTVEFKMIDYHIQ